MCRDRGVCTPTWVYAVDRDLECERLWLVGICSPCLEKKSRDLWWDGRFCQNVHLIVERIADFARVRIGGCCGNEEENCSSDKQNSYLHRLFCLLEVGWWRKERGILLIDSSDVATFQGDAKGSGRTFINGDNAVQDEAPWVSM